MNLLFHTPVNIASFDFAQLQGNDVITGSYYNDTLFGSTGDDVLTGRLGKDTLWGGEGADRFVLNSTLDSWSLLDLKHMDTIMDFRRAQHDKLDLRAIDADTTRAGNNAFHFVGNAGFSGHAGELTTLNTKAGLYVGGDTDGDTIQDFMVFLKGIHAIAKTDLYL